jgi:hypothetical protein
MNNMYETSLRLGKYRIRKEEADILYSRAIAVLELGDFNSANSLLLSASRNETVASELLAEIEGLKNETRAR